MLCLVSLVGMSLYGHRSLPQMQARTTRMIASVGSRMDGSGMFSMRTSPAPYMTIARMRDLLSGTRKQRSAARDRPCCSRYWQGPPLQPGGAPRRNGSQERDPRVPDLEARGSPRRRPALPGTGTTGGFRSAAGGADVCVDYYTRLERGNLAAVSETVLDALVRALRLDEAERAHLAQAKRARSRLRLRFELSPTPRPGVLDRGRSHTRTRERHMRDSAGRGGGLDVIVLLEAL
jgi:Helix-turn-helix domain